MVITKDVKEREREEDLEWNDEYPKEDNPLSVEWFDEVVQTLYHSGSPSLD